MSKKGTSWGWIIFWFACFWPVGLVLLIKKLNDKSLMMTGKTGVYSAFAWFLIIIGLLAFLAFFANPLGEYEIGLLPYAVATLVGGFVILHQVRKVKKAFTRYTKYIDLIQNKSVCNVDAIANTVRLPYVVVIRELQEMISEGYLNGYYINHIRRIVVAKDQRPQGQGARPVNARNVVTVRCSGCGANNAVAAGVVSECEYCGSPVRG